VVGGTREIRAPDGRRLTVWVEGEGDEFVLIHAGTPETGRLYDFDVEVTAEHGLTCVGYSRPGYARSDRDPGRRVADCAGDVLAIADALGIDSFFTIGRSGGGGHALACAALLPDRVRAAALVGASAPRRASGLDWHAGMARKNLKEFGAAEAGYEPLREYLEAEAARWCAATPGDVPALFGDLLPDGAAQGMTQEEKEFSLEAMRNALATGIWGWFDDDMAWIDDWGFDFAGIEAPVTVWHAENDRFMPAAHGEWLAENVPGASLHLHSAEAHMSLPKNAFGEMLDRLLEAGRR
jgi:pimeloyl-ACP methyl ester carboxylesterase